ncbi:CRISPR-associated helicase Cas3' [Paenibacillus sp. IB182496]|uniref:CRISPR-associated helicase Cas3 n=1 Tax=Paenibacillus sabuli TaxID=2772509 RepID=A0A927BXG7_9BACL|nr:CRISPR-associated helicase Cas3' [Paenibacillus sabuli]MBD2848152.1 CRISPR-associated helicase Cas3' [Paenibacillus sabuli]
MGYIAHIRERDHAIQSVRQHLLEVKTLAEHYGAKLGVAHIAGLAGLMHDMGKSTPLFRDYIRRAVFEPEQGAKRGEVDHSTAGGRLMYERLHIGAPKANRLRYLLSEVVGNCIVSHHGYLHDYLSPELESDYLRRVRDKDPIKLDYETARDDFFVTVMPEAQWQAYVDEAVRELEAFCVQPSTEPLESRIMLLTKFVFSALIDADRTNTRLFEEGASSAAPEPEAAEARRMRFQSYYDKLMQHMASYLEREDADSRINRLRREMSAQCEQFAERASGIYSLSIPTGGGKTLASFRYALRHAMRTDKHHIVYVIPYTTIIEQNADEIRRIIEDDAHLLEHHSNVVQDEREDDEYLDGLPGTSQNLKLAKDNWDAPVVFTTMVQFLNVFYARGTRNVRRLHNLSKAVIVFDEVQKVPIPCVSLFNRALNFLKQHADTSMLLCTATQPALEYVEHKLDKDLDGEIVQALDEVTNDFKRVDVHDRTADQPYDTERLAASVLAPLDETPSTLVILNTKSVVQRLYVRLKGCGVPVYHLSTAMCADHRKSELAKIREHLDREEPVVCVSTPLIEAGVDVSFHRVIRSLAGLDSIAQAAGRCNRHGEKGTGQVDVIRHAEEDLRHLPEIRAGQSSTEPILIDLRGNPELHGGHMLSTGAMRLYFQRYYRKLENELNYPIPRLGQTMTSLLIESRTSQDSYYDAYKAHRQKGPLNLFMTNAPRTAADHFEVIATHGVSAIAPYGDGKRLIAALNSGLSIQELGRELRAAQQFTVNLMPHEQRRLSENGGLEALLDGKVLVLKEGAYSKEYGLNVNNDGRFEAAIC